MIDGDFFGDWHIELVRVSNLTSESFESHKGLRQGDGLSCLLFNGALEGVIRGAGLDIDIRWHDPLPVSPISWLRG